MTRLLVDTHIALWVLFEPRRLSATARRLLSAPDARPIFSVASVWEMSIKAAFGKLAVDVALVRATLLQDGFEELPILGKHAERVVSLPKLHADPFDRMLIAQAMTEPVRLLTVDRKLEPYSELVVMA